MTDEDFLDQAAIGFLGWAIQMNLKRQPSLVPGEEKVELQTEQACLNAFQMGNVMLKIRRAVHAKINEQRDAAKKLRREQRRLGPAVAAAISPPAPQPQPSSPEPPA